MSDVKRVTIRTETRHEPVVSSAIREGCGDSVAGVETTIRGVVATLEVVTSDPAAVLSLPVLVVVDATVQVTDA